MNRKENPKNEMIRIRMTVIEKDKIRQRAKRAKISMSEYVMEALKVKLENKRAERT